MISQLCSSEVQLDLTGSSALVLTRVKSWYRPAWSLIGGPGEESVSRIS